MKQQPMIIANRPQNVEQMRLMLHAIAQLMDDTGRQAAEMMDGTEPIGDCSLSLMVEVLCCWMALAEEGEYAKLCTAVQAIIRARIMDDPSLCARVFARVPDDDEILEEPLITYKEEE